MLCSYLRRLDASATLGSLDLSGWGILDYPVTLTTLSALTSVDLDNNNISELPLYVLQTFTSVRTLRLRRCAYPAIVTYFRETDIATHVPEIIYRYFHWSL